MTYITKAASRGVTIDELEVTIEARVDLQGTFELNSARAGLSDVTVTVGVRSDVDDAVLDELAQTTRRTFAVYDSLVNPVPMRLHVQRLPRRAASGLWAVGARPGTLVASRRGSLPSSAAHFHRG